MKLDEDKMPNFNERKIAKSHLDDFIMVIVLPLAWVIVIVTVGIFSDEINSFLMAIVQFGFRYLSGWRLVFLIPFIGWIGYMVIKKIL